ncbi:MAG: pyruvate kinase [Candidatus Actinomarinales bacterium]|nr:MAG: pyruvate kinase [Candidatus Actinomarinales bacterium]
MTRKTKIIATVGPSVNSKDGIKKLVNSGADVLRLNFSHGTEEDHLNVVKWARELDKSVAIMQDIQGPKIRTGETKKEVYLKPKNKVKITNKKILSDEKIVYLNYKDLYKDINSGERIFIDDGQIVIRVTKKTISSLDGVVEIGGELRSNQGVAFPDTSLSVSSLTKKDISDLKYGNKLEVDIVAVSFVRNANDIKKVRKIIDNNIKIIAKIELKSAIKNLDSIIDEADGVMVARGDLGVQLPLERVPFIQKQILDEANAKGKITVTATEMLQSMKESHRPTRAEVSDITNAILEGTDCVMLSAETAIGNHPNVVVEAMSRICEEVDSRNDTSALKFKELSGVDTLTTSIAKAAVQVANEIGAKAIVAFTETGKTPLLISNYRPKAPIFTFTTKDKTYNQMHILWGVEQAKIERLETTDEMFEIADTWLQINKKFKKNDKVVLVAGTPPNKEAATNLLRVMKIGEF